jgi:HK97 family phage prohead protease
MAEADSSGFFVAADLSKSAAAKEMYEEIKEGLVTKMSWAFTVKEESYNEETRTRTILKVKKVYDVSAVSMPANDGTEISARSFVDGVIEKEHQELIKRRRNIEIAEALKLKLKIKEVLK